MKCTECNNEVVARGLCKNHYMRWYRHGDTKLHLEGRTGRPKLHGYNATSPTYVTWMCMLRRCRDKTNKRYGGKGIQVCKEWYDFRNFLADMGERPDGMTLDRMDSNGNYEASNCRWATAKEQASNRDRNK